MMAFSPNFTMKGRSQSNVYNPYVYLEAFGDVLIQDHTQNLISRAPLLYPI